MIRLDYGCMFRERLDQVHGLPRATLRRLGDRFKEVHADVRDRRARGEYGFVDLPDHGSELRQIASFAEGIGQAFDHILVLGIGGSALGTKVLLEALKPSAWNELSDEQRDYYPRLTVLDNIDPWTMRAALGRIDPRRALVNVVSKSGSTAETLAQYLVVRAWLEDALGAEVAPRHLVFTTDPARGPLRELAARDAIVALDIPPNVGGRFSVLSPVGLLPAALVGVDVAELLRGARAGVERGEPAELTRNLPALYAGLQWAADTELGARIHAVMPYSDRLRVFTEWFRQLWAESLGKALDRRGQKVHVGPTPLGAVGVTDQHSLVQLFVEGPFDKTVTVVGIEAVGDDVAIPAAGDGPEAVAYLGGHTMGALLSAERDATVRALADAGRMSATLWLPAVDAASVGEVIMLCQLATVYAGAWYGVDPLGQPGVERGKVLTYGAMGRPGYAAAPRLAAHDDWV